MMKKILTVVLAVCFLCVAAAGCAQMEDVPFGFFEAMDILGEEAVTEGIFAEAEITLVSFWATWCPPCVRELPTLAKLYEESGGRVQVLGVLIDALDENGELDNEVIETGRVLLDEAGVAFPVVVPDAWLAKLSTLIYAVPTTILVDKNGNIIDTEIGARTSVEEWLEVAYEALGDAQ